VVSAVFGSTPPGSPAPSSSTRRNIPSYSEFGIFLIREGVLEQFALTAEGQTRAGRLFHQGDLLRQKPPDIHRVGRRFPGFPFEQQVVAIDVDDIPFRKTLRAVFPEKIETDRDRLFAEFDPADDGVGRDFFDEGILALPGRASF